MRWTCVIELQVDFETDDNPDLARDLWKDRIHEQTGIRPRTYTIETARFEQARKPVEPFRIPTGGRRT